MTIADWIDEDVPRRHNGGVDLRHLRYFAAAVEEGSFLGAAERLNVAHPALSRRIRDLEESLGCSLLERGTRGVKPTRAGAAFYRDVVGILEALAQASHRARLAGLDQGREVRLGLPTASRKYEFIQDAIASYAAEHPHASIAYMHSQSPDLALALREGRIDLTLLYERHLGGWGLSERMVHKEQYVLAVHPSHRLAEAEPVELAQLSGEPLVWMSRRDAPDSFDALLQQCRLHGLEPVVAHAAGTFEEQIDFTIVSRGVCLTPASSMRTIPAGMLLFRPLPSFQMRLHVTLAWGREIDSSPVQSMLTELHRAIDRHQADIATGAVTWSRLLGHQVAWPPEASDASDTAQA